MPAAEAPSLAEVIASVGALVAAWPHRAAVIGGIAMVARVRPRHTIDVDLVVAVPEGAGARFLELARSHGWTDDPTETEALLEGGLLRLFRGPPRDEDPRLDVIFVDSEYLERVLARATPVDLGVVTLPVATVEDLLLLKLEAHRPQDVDDVLAIKDAYEAVLDWSYVRSEAERLGLVDRLALYFDR